MHSLVVLVLGLLVFSDAANVGSVKQLEASPRTGDSSDVMRPTANAAAPVSAAKEQPDSNEPPKSWAPVSAAEVQQKIAKVEPEGSEQEEDVDPTDEDGDVIEAAAPVVAAQVQPNSHLQAEAAKKLQEFEEQDPTDADGDVIQAPSDDIDPTDAKGDVPANDGNFDEADPTDADPTDAKGHVIMMNKMKSGDVDEDPTDANGDVKADTTAASDFLQRDGRGGGSPEYDRMKREHQMAHKVTAKSQRFNTVLGSVSGVMIGAFLGGMAGYSNEMPGQGLLFGGFAGGFGGGIWGWCTHSDEAKEQPGESPKAKHRATELGK